EDVKELYYYLDSTPTHSYLKFLYKYPQAEFPYARLLEENHRRSRNEPEFELLDTGIFDTGRYFDVIVEYAKAGPEDILIQVEAWNRGPEEAKLEVLPTFWFRNTWSWNSNQNGERPVLAQGPVVPDGVVIHSLHPRDGEMWLRAQGAPDPLFTENETN